MPGPIIVLLKSVYGVDRAYPRNEAAKRVATLLGKKTLSLYQLQELENLGFTVEFETPSVNALMERVL